MRCPRLCRSGSTVAVFAVAVLLGVSSETSAQGQTPSRPDFLFGRPSGSIAFRGTWVIARGGDECPDANPLRCRDVYRFVERQLTIDRGDFNTGAFATDVGFALSSRADVVVGFDFSRASIASEYRDFVDNNRLPIEQTTTLQELNLTGSIRFALTPRGREISRLAWVPGTVVPYVGGGGGMMWYEFKQVGDFVDALDVRPTGLAIFSDTFEGQGWTPSAHALAGVDVKLYHRWYLTVDGRYVWAAGDLGQEFENFDPIDLTGVRFGVGINVLF
jgi:hypothetical protein